MAAFTYAMQWALCRYAAGFHAARARKQDLGSSAIGSLLPFAAPAHEFCAECLLLLSLS